MLFITLTAFAFAGVVQPEAHAWRSHTQPTIVPKPSVQGYIYQAVLVGRKPRCRIQRDMDAATWQLKACVGDGSVGSKSDNFA